MFFDLVTGNLYYSSGSAIFEFDSIGKPNLSMSWKSKEFIAPKPVNFGAIMVEADNEITYEDEQAIQDQIEQDIATNITLLAGESVGDLNGAALNEYDLDGDNLIEVAQNNGTFNYAVSVVVIADDEVVATVGRVKKMVRLPGGFQARKWEILVSGDMRIVQITMAQTGFELAGA